MTPNAGGKSNNKPSSSNVLAKKKEISSKMPASNLTMATPPVIRERIEERESQ